MAFTPNPLTFQNEQIDTPQQRHTFMQRLAAILNQITTTLTSAIQLAQLLNGQGLLLGSALAPGTLLGANFAKVIVDLGTITTDQTVAVAGANFVYIHVSSATTQVRTITLTNLPQGAVVLIEYASTAGTLTLKLAATDPNANVYTIAGWVTSTLAVFDYIGTGNNVAPGNTNIFFGMTGWRATTANPRWVGLAA
jgi:hypothetical protein